MASKDCDWITFVSIGNFIVPIKVTSIFPTLLTYLFVYFDGRQIFFRHLYRHFFLVLVFLFIFLNHFGFHYKTLSVFILMLIYWSEHKTKIYIFFFNYLKGTSWYCWVWWISFILIRSLLKTPFKNIHDITFASL